MVEDCDAKCFASKRTFHITPCGALLFALTSPQAVGVQVGLARIGLVPRHAHRKAADKEFAEGHVLFSGAEQEVEVDRVSVGGFGRMEGDSVLFFEYDVAIRRDELDERAP